MVSENNLILRSVKNRAYYYIDCVTISSLPLNDSIAYLTPKEACKSDLPASAKKSLNIISDPSFGKNLGGTNSDWFSPSQGTPDFIDNGIGKYAGLYLHSPVNKDNREYISSKLKNQLDPCYKYHFQFDLKKSAISEFEVDRIGIAFTDSFYRKENRMLFEIEKEFETPKNLIISNSDTWITVCSELNPQSCANYIIVGNFSSDAETIVMPSGQMETGARWAYYEVDNFVLKKGLRNANCTLKCNSNIKNISSISKAGKSQDTILTSLSSPSEKDTLLFLFPSSQTAPETIDSNGIAKLKQKLKNNPDYNIVVAGHADNTGNEANNIKLSMQRAQSVSKILILEGIDPSRIKVLYFGSSQQKTDNVTESGKAKNRRVEVYLKN